MDSFFGPRQVGCTFSTTMVLRAIFFVSVRFRYFCFSKISKQRNTPLEASTPSKHNEQVVVHNEQVVVHNERAAVQVAVHNEQVVVQVAVCFVCNYVCIYACFPIGGTRSPTRSPPFRFTAALSNSNFHNTPLQSNKQYERFHIFRAAFRSIVPPRRSLVVCAFRKFLA